MWSYVVYVKVNPLGWYNPKMRAQNCATDRSQNEGANWKIKGEGEKKGVRKECGENKRR
jgi:hypothetical protein